MRCSYWQRISVFQANNIPYIQTLITMKEWAKRQSSWSYLKTVEITRRCTCVDYVAKLCATSGITIATTIQNISNACYVILFTIGKTTWRHTWNLSTILIISLACSKDKIDFFECFLGSNNYRCIYQCGTSYTRGYVVVQLVEVLRYKPEGHRFDSRWCHWNFLVT